MRTLAAAGVLVVSVISAASTTGASPLPPGFLGVNISTTVLRPPATPEAEFRRMAAAGAQEVTIPAEWPQIQPSAPGSSLPAGWVREGSVPTDYARLDRLVLGASSCGLRVRLLVTGAPRWVRRGRSPSAPPTTSVRYAALVAALVRRYGPHGSVWSRTPSGTQSAVRDWEIWRQPNARGFWDSRPAPPDGGSGMPAAYVRMLRRAAWAIHALDPGARVITGSLVWRSWSAIERFFALGGSAAGADAIGIAAYAPTPAASLEVLGLDRQALRRHGAGRMPIVVTEIGWPSSLGFAFPEVEVEANPGTSEQGQARLLREALTAIARVRARLGIAAVSWANWLTEDSDLLDSFNFMGLRRLDPGFAVVDKPALRAFEQVARLVASGGL